MRVAIIGYGKMGKAIEVAARNNYHQIGKIVDVDNPINSLNPGDVDVAIEFTRPESAYENISYCIENQIPVISGTTGWLDKYDQVVELCQKQNGTFLCASNFSVGVNLFFAMNEWLAKRMAQLQFEGSIEEIHHTEKLDSPSGTAITLAEGIQKHQPEIEGWINELSTDHKKIGIVSKRIPNVPGTHTVSYKSNLETVSIQHTAHDRSVFAEGAIQVADWIKDKRGVFTMSDFINEGSDE